MRQYTVLKKVLARPAWRARCVRGAAALAVATMLVSCGGGGGGAAPSEPAQAPPGDAAPGTGNPDTGKVSREAAARFLTQASFGPDPASVQRVIDLGYAAWIDEQWAVPASSHLAAWDAMTAAVQLKNPSGWAGQDGVINAFWRAAVAGDDQLRQRVAYALSQIFVVSMQDTLVGNDPRAVAHYLDLLADKGTGRYRDLLEAVALHPMMGRYLSTLGNRKADTRTGRVPDENFAREVMQLFSIGLTQLDLDGTPRTADGAPVPTYTPADISGLARVFTGWSWACPVAPTATDSTCYTTGAVRVDGTSRQDPQRSIKPMISYPAMHEAREKHFLGTVIAAGTDGPTSLRMALDTLAGHPNVGPFIGRQLIQRLVTSNPSPAYVRSVAQVFNATGGDMKAVVKAILLHPEARTPGATTGRLKEPVLRVTGFLRAFGARSDSGFFKIGNTDDPATKLGQTPMRSPSVFNFYRPGYVPPGSQAAAAGLVAPEFQIAHETSAAGYVNYVRQAAFFGVGVNPGGTLNRPDVQPDYSAELALAATPPALVDLIDTKLMGGQMPAAVKAEIVNAISTIGISATNTTHAEHAKRQRVAAAVMLTLVSPEFQVQK